MIKLTKKAEEEYLLKIKKQTITHYELAKDYSNIKWYSLDDGESYVINPSKRLINAVLTSVNYK